MRANKPARPRFVSLLPVELMEVSFGGRGGDYHEIENDELTETYAAPQWLDKNGDGIATNENGEKNQSVAYTRNTQPQIGCKFKIGDLPGNTIVMVRAKGSDGIEVPETQVTKIGDVYTLPLTFAAIKHGSQRTPTKWPNIVKFYSRHPSNTFNKPFLLDWEVKIDSGEWARIGSTKHQVYLTLENPNTDSVKGNHESLFYIGCNGAHGKGDIDDVVTGIWDEFTDRRVSRVDPIRGEGTRDIGGMEYWRNGQAASWFPSVDDLLRSGHDTCVSWAEFFQALLDFQGISGHSLKRIVPIKAPSVDYEDAISAFAQSSGIDRASISYSYGEISQPKSGPQPEGGAEDGDVKLGLFPVFFVNQLNLQAKTIVPIPVNGFPGSSSKAQGTSNAKAVFRDHFIVEYDSKLYDPSYGTGPFEGNDRHTKWEDASLQFFGLQIQGYKYKQIDFHDGPDWSHVESTLWIHQDDPKGSTETEISNAD